MKKILLEYTNIFAYMLIGFVFGISFFLLFINFYHFKSVNDVYIKQDSDYSKNEEIKKRLTEIKNNVNSFDINLYNGNEDPYELLLIKSKLNICLSKIDSEKMHSILNKKEVSIRDVYEMQQFYKINISNECLVKQLYELSLNDSRISSLYQIGPFIQNNIDNLIYSTDYVQKVIKNNSSYYFNSDLSKINIYHQTIDSYYNILNNYNLAIDFIYDISVWYKQLLGGGQ